MSSCLCHIPPATLSGIGASASASASLGLSLSPIGLKKMNLAAGLAATASLDASDMLGLSKAMSMVPPSFNMSVAGALLQVSLMLKLTPKTFSLLDPITLQKELDIMATAVNRRAGGINMLAGISMSGLLKITAVARATLKLKLAGLDLDAQDFLSKTSAMASSGMRMSMHMPKIGILGVIGIPTKVLTDLAK